MKHFDSLGEYFSFGNKALFGRRGYNNNSTVGIYESTKIKHDKQHIINAMVNKYENKIAEDLGKGISTFVPIINNIKEYIAPILNVGKKIQDNRNQIHLQEVASSKFGLWSSQLCVDAQTQILHTENDCTYTMIVTPRQENVDNDYEFIFQLNEFKSIGITMHNNTNFIFTGLFLTHKQVCNRKNKSNDTEKKAFFNLASYGNARLFNHFKQSLIRNNNI